MQETELSGPAAVTRNFGTFALVSLSIIALSAVGSLIVSFPIALIIISTIFCMAVAVRVITILDGKILFLSSAIMISFSAIGISVEKEEVIGVYAEIIAFSAVGALLISASLLTYRIFSPLWTKSL